MSHSQRHTVRVRSDHSVVLQNPAWVPGQTMEILVLESAQPVAPYTALLALQSSDLNTPEDFSTSYESIIKHRHG